MGMTAIGATGTPPKGLGHLQAVLDRDLKEWSKTGLERTLRGPHDSTRSERSRTRALERFSRRASLCSCRLSMDVPLLPDGLYGAATSYDGQIDGRLRRDAPNSSLAAGARNAAFSLRRASVWTCKGSHASSEHLVCASGMCEDTEGRMLALWMRGLCGRTWG